MVSIYKCIFITVQSYVTPKTRTQLCGVDPPSPPFPPSWFITENSYYANYYYWNKEMKYQQLSCLDFTHSLTPALSISTNWLVEAHKAWVFDCMFVHDYWQSRLNKTVFTTLPLMCHVIGWQRNVIRYLWNLPESWVLR